MYDYICQEVKVSSIQLAYIKKMMCEIKLNKPRCTLKYIIYGCTEQLQVRNEANQVALFSASATTLD